jgi:tetratricopeptide (TPR) repeat protein
VTKSAKIGWTIAISVAGILIAGVSFAVLYLISVQRGAHLAREGYVASFQGDYDRAIERFSAALEKPLNNHQTSFVYLNRGVAYNFKWQFAEAIRDHTAALRFNPKLSDAYAGRGFAYQRKGELEKAISDFTEAIRLDPNSPVAYYNRGLIFLQRAEPDRALADFNEAVRCNPRGAEPLVMRGLCYAAKNDLDHALANFDGAIAVDPINAMGHLERSNLYFQKGDKEKGRRDYEEAHRLNPNIEQAFWEFTSFLGQRQWLATMPKSWSQHFGKPHSDIFQ